MGGRFRRDAGGYSEWVRLTDTPLLVLALVFLGVLVLPMATSLSGAATVAVEVADGLIWSAFLIDYCVRLYLASDRAQYVRRNVIDLLVVVLPFLRPIRAVRLLQLFRVGAVAGVANKRVASLHARMSWYAGTSALMLVLLAGTGMYHVEHTAAHSNIRTLPDGLWWAIATITTVGYGDRFPTTDTGKLIAVALMVFGIALLGVITASIATWLVSHLARMEQEEERAEATLDTVLAAVHQLHARLDALEASPAKAANPASHSNDVSVAIPAQKPPSGLPGRRRHDVVAPRAAGRGRRA